MKSLPKHERHVGLARAISKLGYSSRSQAVDLIHAGRVLLNGKVCRNPEAPSRLGKDRIEIDGNQVEESEKLYFMLNKPRGIVTTASDEKGRDTVYSLLPRDLPWLAPVGRLDKASEGLLLLTNDSEWGARILDPATHVEKTYHVQIEAVANAKLIESLKSGVSDEPGGCLQAKRASILRGGAKNTWLEIILNEGKNRQIRRMLAQLDVGVLRIVRVSIGPVVLGNLAKGKFRALTKEEKLSLDQRTDRSKISGWCFRA
jgi:23S rRNA pseudouridine2605 synthase